MMGDDSGNYWEVGTAWNLLRGRVLKFIIFHKNNKKNEEVVKKGLKIGYWENRVDPLRF